MPNTKDNWLTTATVHDEDRAALWRRIFHQPDDEPPQVPIVSVIPVTVEIPGYDKPQAAYQLDLDAITTRQRLRLADALAERFDLDPLDVHQDLDKIGVPILATDVTVSSRDQALVMGMLL